MNALLIIAHGSRTALANAETLQLAHRIAKHMPLVALAFLEFAPPPIDEAVAGLVADGATQITVLPYLLAAGRHAAQDIPQQISQMQAQHPHLEFKTLPHLGALPGLDALILSALAPPQLSPAAS